MSLASETIVVNSPDSIETVSRYFFYLGLFATLLIFNQIYVGNNFSLLWLGVIAGPLFSPKRFLRWNYAVILLFLALFLIKFVCAANFAAIARYIIYILFVALGAASMREAQFDRFFEGFHIGLALNIAFACVQMVGKITHAYDATFPVTLWNPSLWHAVMDEGMLTFYPRVSGFTNEPAYLGTLLLVASGYRLFIQERPVFSGRYGFYLTLSVFLLVNSRTTFIGYCWLAGCSILLMFEKWRFVRFVFYSVYSVSFILLPAIIMITTDTGDLKALADEDISIFARAVPLTWIEEANNLTWANYLLGVGDYRVYSQTVNMSEVTFQLLDNQGGLLDSKSQGGTYFYDLGLVGLVVFIFGVFYLCRGRPRALLFVSLINIVFFNVYAFSWPLFWLCMIGCGLKGRKPSGRESFEKP